MTSPIRKDYGPMDSRFKCSSCGEYQSTQGAQYIAKPGDPLHCVRTCASCIGLAADRAEALHAAGAR